MLLTPWSFFEFVKLSYARKERKNDACTSHSQCGLKEKRKD